MKPRHTLLLGLASAVLFSSSALAEVRTWTDAQGRQVIASFVRLDGEDIVLKMENGNEFQFALSKLSAEDQEVAKGMSADAPPAAPAAPAVAPANSGLAGFNYPASAAGSAAKQIDLLVAQGIVGKGNKWRVENEFAPIAGFNPLTSDEQFVRRVYLDAVGRIPNHDEAKDFITDSDPQKRSKLIDKLLSSDGYTSHMFNYMAEMLRVTHNLQQANLRGDDYVNWLKRQVTNNRPWNEMVYQMLTATGKMWSEDPNLEDGHDDKGAAGYLLRDGGMPLDNLANTLTVFLGTDVACAQCHDHPFADWTQMQFYELAAFFGASDTRTRYDRDMSLMEDIEALVTESGQDITRLRNGIRNFIQANSYSVRDMDENKMKLPHDYKYSDGDPYEAVDPKFVMWSGRDKSNPAYKQAKGKPENLRVAFASWATHPENPRFAMTIANRLWKRAFGSGVAEPVTNIDDPELSSNPKLLEFLGEAMKKLNFDMKEFQRAIFNSRAYQAEATTEAIPMGAPYFFQGPQLRRMTAEQTWDSYMTLVLGAPEQYKAPLSDLYGKSVDLNLENEKLDAQTVLIKYSAYREMGKKINALMGGGLDAAGGDMMMMGGEDAMEEEAEAATGGGEFLTYRGMRLLRASELPQPERAGHFLSEFGQSPRLLIDGGSLEGSVPQVLTMMNGAAQEMLTNRDSLVFRAIDKVNSPSDKMEAMFLSIMGRRPTLQEKDIAQKEIAASGEEGYANMIWALINTREFIFIQ